jgi:hypothetical protein
MLTLTNIVNLDESVVSVGVDGVPLPKETPPAERFKQYEKQINQQRPELSESQK